MKASASGKLGNCIHVDEIDVGPNRGQLVITETDRPDRTIITSRENFAAFVAGIKDDEFDRFLPDPAPKYQPGFYRLRGRLELGALGTLQAGALLVVTDSRHRAAVVTTGDVPRTSVTHDQLDDAGAKRVDNP
jgi:hypothetical protein